MGFNESVNIPMICVLNLYEIRVKVYKKVVIAIKYFYHLSRGDNLSFVGHFKSVTGESYLLSKEFHLLPYCQNLLWIPFFGKKGM